MHSRCVYCEGLLAKSADIMKSSEVEGAHAAQVGIFLDRLARANKNQVKRSPVICMPADLVETPCS